MGSICSGYCSAQFPWEWLTFPWLVHTSGRLALLPNAHQGPPWPWSSLGKGAEGRADCDSLTPSQVFFPVTCPNTFSTGKPPSQSLYVLFCFMFPLKNLAYHSKERSSNAWGGHGLVWPAHRVNEVQPWMRQERQVTAKSSKPFIKRLKSLDFIHRMIKSH